MTKRVLSGIRPTNRLHLGNYLGAVKGMLHLQENPDYERLYMVVDLHALTTPNQSETLKESTRNVYLDYLATGLDPKKSTIFIQSDLADLHAQMMFYISSVMTVARMQHLPTFKEKVKQHPGHVTMALLNYPVLMAADILIYQANLVPVGIDQVPHLEVAREVARKMNEEYGLGFPMPKRFATSGEYVPSLTGEGKMSKSLRGSYISLTDNLEVIRKRLAAVPTDSGQGEKIPTTGGVASLLSLVSLFQGEKRSQDYRQNYLGKGIRYSDLKKELAEAIYQEISPLQERRKKIEQNFDYLDQTINEGALKAREIAQETVREVKEKIGLR